MRPVRRVGSPLLVLALFVLGGFGLSVLTSGTVAVVRVPRPTFDDLSVAAAAVLAWILFGYLALGALLTLLAALPGAVGSACGAIADAVTPRAYRRVAQFALGLTVLAGPAFGTVGADATPGSATIRTSSSSAPNLDRPGATADVSPVDLDVPGRPDGRRLDLDRPGNTTTAPRATDRDPLIRPVRDVDEDHYTVRRGDCLWHLAERHLGTGATSPEITAEWHRWYRANRDVIGDDPDLILVGQVFRVP
jgi:hypothetical protein